MNEVEEKLMPQYGENQPITDGNYDKSLAVKCVNGTFVGQKKENVISYKGIPFVGQQPVGDLRWKAPVDVTPDSGIYEACYYGKSPVQAPGDPASLYPMGEDCLYLNIWRSDDATPEEAGHRVDLRWRLRGWRNDRPAVRLPQPGDGEP